MVGDTLMLGPDTFWLSATLTFDRVALWKAAGRWDGLGV